MTATRVKEYEETLNKAKALLKAIEQAEREGFKIKI